jgi:hypothetical protein
MHTFLSGLIAKKLLAEDAVVVVLGKAPGSCCKELGSLLPELKVHHVHHPMYTGKFAFAHCKDAHVLPDMKDLHNGEQWSVFVYSCHTTCLTLLRLLPHSFERIWPCSAQQVSISKDAPHTSLTSWRIG